jgi:lysyl endopeptidase
MNKFIVFITFIWSLSCVFTFAEKTQAKDPGKVFPRAFMERSPGNFDPAAYWNAMKEKSSWLMAESVPLSSDSIITLQVTPGEPGEIDDHECQTCGESSRSKVRVGVSRELNVDVSFEGFTLESLPDRALLHSKGMLRCTPGGGFTWTTAVESGNATALRVHLTDFSLPPNASLYIYNTEGEAFGPYTHLGPNKNGDFWTNTVFGSVVYLQLHCSGSISREDIHAIHFKIAGVGCLGSKFLLPFRQNPREDDENLSYPAYHCSYNAPCVEDARCIDGSTFPAIEYVRYGVAFMQWVSGPYIYMCSGGLLSDLVPETQIPYFLTANHCISTDSEAQSLECYFRYWNPYCHAPCISSEIYPSTLGAKFLSGSKTNGDYTLLVLSQDPPAGSTFLGWDTAPVAFYHLVDLFRLSHPKGAPQAFSRHIVDTTLKTCKGLPRGRFIYSNTVIGATEYGSDGAPVVNIYGLVVGHFSGNCVYKEYDPCNYETYATLDGAFASYFPEISKWLIPY